MQYSDVYTPLAAAFNLKIKAKSDMANDKLCTFIAQDVDKERVEETDSHAVTDVQVLHVYIFSAI